MFLFYSCLLFKCRIYSLNVATLHWLLAWEVVTEATYSPRPPNKITFSIHKEQLMVLSHKIMVNSNPLPNPSISNSFPSIVVLRELQQLLTSLLQTTEDTYKKPGSKKLATMLTESPWLYSLPLGPEHKHTHTQVIIPRTYGTFAQRSRNPDLCLICWALSKSLTYLNLNIFLKQFFKCQKNY